MLLALTGGQKLAIVAVALVFIAFALASSFLLPRRDPDFPGARRLRLFVAVSVALFVAMIATMVVFAREPEEAEPHGAGSGQTETHGGGTETGGTETGGTETAGTETGDGVAPAGDAERGETVYESAGCGSCHVLEAAGSNGSVGPNLDEARPSFETTVEQVTNGGGGMPPFADSLSEDEIQDVSAYVVASTGGG